MADYRKEARRAAIRAGINPDVFERQIQAESGFNPNARSPAGASGIAQIMPGTAKSWGVDPMDPKAALGAAARNMAAYVKKYGSYENALRAYNAGPGAIERSKGYAETNKYVSTILGGETPSTKGVGNGTGGGGDRGMSPPPTSAQTTPVSIGSQFDEAGFAKAQRRALLAKLMQSTGQPAGDNALLTSGALSAKPPERSDYRTESDPIAIASTATPTQKLTSQMAGVAGHRASPQRSSSPGKIIGVPHSGTHTLGNWQSDNAVDISMPTGTVLQSMGDGVVEKVSGGYSGGASRFDGYQVTVRFKDGNRAFYTHLSKAGVKPGQQVRAGQALGRSGAANGVPHLHLGVEKGDPRKLIQRGRR